MKYLLAGLALMAASTVQARDVTISWDAYTDESAVGVNIYTEEFDVLTSSCMHDTMFKQTNAPVPTTETQFTIVGLDDTKSYCIWARGVAADGTESDYSNAAMFFKPKPPFHGPRGIRLMP